MKPVYFKGYNVVIAKEQPQYRPLPAHCAAGKATFCWRLTWKERLKLLFRGELWHQVLTLGKPLQPQKLTVEKPKL